MSEKKEKWLQKMSKSKKKFSVSWLINQLIVAEHYCHGNILLNNTVKYFS